VRVGCIRSGWEWCGPWTDSSAHARGLICINAIGRGGGLSAGLDDAGLAPLGSVETEPLLLGLGDADPPSRGRIRPYRHPKSQGLLGTVIFIPNTLVVPSTSNMIDLAFIAYL